MCATNDGFKIAEKDLEIRGPGDIEGTRQSGVLNFKLANLLADKQLVDIARKIAIQILDIDPELESAENLPLNNSFNHKKEELPGVKFHRQDLTEKNVLIL